MSRAIVYIRVSTEDQAESGLGLEAQLSACRKHAVHMRWEIAREFSDDTSGGLKLENRPVLLAAIAELGRGDILLVAKRDRLSRGDILTTAMIEASVERRRARIVSAAGEGTDSNDPSAVLMRRMIDAFAEYERLIIGARTRAALAVKRSRDERTGQVPYGRRLTGNGPLSRNSGLPTGLEPVPTEEEAVSLVNELRADGASLRAIAAEMNRRGIPTKSGNGKGWHFGTIRRIVGRNGHGQA